jgi:hypothetical protein
MQKGCSADPHSLPLREEENDRAVAGASRRVEDTPQKRDHQSSPEEMNSTPTKTCRRHSSKRDRRSSPEEMNSTPTNVPEAPTLPQICARKPRDRRGRDADARS